MVNRIFILKWGNRIFVLFMVICSVVFYFQNYLSKNLKKSINNEIHFQIVSNHLKLDEILKILSDNAKKGGFYGK